MAISVKGSGGGSGVSSSDVTAAKAQVLNGYSTVTTDSNDEVVQGTINTWEGEKMLTKVSTNPVYVRPRAVKKYI